MTDINLRFTISIDKPRRLWWILPDDMLDPPVEREGKPMTCQYRPQKTINFTSELQNFIFGLNRSDNEARDHAAFAPYRDTWNTVGKFSDGCYNYITGEGDINQPAKMEVNIGMRANVVSGEPVISDGSMGIPAGIPVLKIEVLDPNNLPANISYFGNEHLVHHQIIGKGIANGSQGRNPFPQMGGRIVAPYKPCLTALISPVPLYIRMDELKEVASIPNPYNPAWLW